MKQLCKILKKPVYLDSNQPKIVNNRFDIFSAEPLYSRTFFNSVKSISTKYHKQSCIDDFINFCTDKYKNLVNNLPSKQVPLPFTHGLVGYCSYDIGEKILLRQSKDILDSDKVNAFPESFAGLYTWSYVYCHKSEKGYMTFSPLCSQALRNTILSSIRVNDIKSAESTIKGLQELNWIKSQTFTNYANAFRRIKDYIVNGDCYQVNLTQRFETHSSENAADLYFATRERIKTPYSCFFSFSDTQHLLSFSPEQFISINNRKITSKPIKGTIKNNGPIENEEHLLKNEKNKAENVMIVDLLRNDLGKVCKTGSIKVPELFQIETYINVHHLVSRIEGKLKDGISELNAFFSCFPGGSITGAPKVRAMEVIQELEKHKRSAYCGSVFYLNHDGNFDSSILIRTVVKNKDSLHCWAGGGIVADSELEDEYNESLIKVSNIINLDT